MASISHSAFLGSVFTATQLRAGLEVKYWAYTSLKAAKSPISAKKQVVLTLSLIHICLGLLGNGEEEKAAHCFDEAQRLDPNHGGVRVHRALLRERG